MGLAAVIATQLGQTLLSNARSPVVIVTSAASAGALVLVVNTPGGQPVLRLHAARPGRLGHRRGQFGHRTAASVAAPWLVPARRSTSRAPHPYPRNGGD